MNTRPLVAQVLVLPLTVMLLAAWPLAAAAQGHTEPAARTANGSTTDAMMTTLPLQTVIGPGPDTQTVPLFKGPRRTLTQITLRNGATLSAHKAAVPITIHCVAGSGTLAVAGRESPLALTPGVLVTIEPGVVHEIVAAPAVSILLTQFTER